MGFAGGSVQSNDTCVLYTVLQASPTKGRTGNGVAVHIPNATDDIATKVLTVYCRWTYRGDKHSKHDQGGNYYTNPQHVEYYAPDVLQGCGTVESLPARET